MHFTRLHKLERFHRLLSTLASSAFPNSEHPIDANTVVATLHRLRSLGPLGLWDGQGWEEVAAQAQAQASTSKEPAEPVVQQGMLSRKHVEQAMRMAKDALDEDAKALTKNGDGMSDFAADLFCSAIGYLLAAPLTPTDETLRTKFLSMLQRSPLYNEVTSAASVATQAGAPPKDTEVNARVQYSAESEPRSWLDPCSWVPYPEEVVSRKSQTTFASTKCGCGRHVVVPTVSHLPPSVYPRTMNELFIASLIWSAVFVKRSPVPYYVSLSMSYMLGMFLSMSTIMFPFGRLIATSVLERTLEIDSELELQQRFATFIAWGFEITLKVFLALSRAEAWAPPGAYVANKPTPSMYSSMPNQPVVVIAPPAPRFPSLASTSSGQKTPAPTYEQAMYGSGSQFGSRSLGFFPPNMAQSPTSSLFSPSL